MVKAMGRLVLDRRVPDGFLESLGPDGPLGFLLRMALEDRELLDLQLRRKVGSTPECGAATLYAGLTAVLTVEWSGSTSSGAGPRARADCHRHYRGVGGGPLALAGSFQPSWRYMQPANVLAAQSAELTAHARAIIDFVRDKKTLTDKEGRVHASIAATQDPDYVAVNREVTIGFANDDARLRWMAALKARFTPALGPLAWKPLGTGLDFLGIDTQGRLLAIEAKPKRGSGIPRGPMQVRAYAELLADWIAAEPDARQIVEGMGAQRCTLGLSPFPPPLAGKLVVVPVLAIEEEPTVRALVRVRDLAGRLARVPRADGRVAAFECWSLAVDGGIEHREVLG
jgi:hypothetical protein